MQARLLIPRGLGPEEGSRLRVGLEPPCERGGKRAGSALLVAIPAGTGLLPPLERGAAGRENASLRLELGHACDVHPAPRACPLPWRKADLVRLVVDAPTQAVDPPEAQRFVNGQGPGDTPAARPYLVEAHPEDTLAVVVPLKPLPPTRRRGEEPRHVVLGHGLASHCPQAVCKPSC